MVKSDRVIKKWMIVLLCNVLKKRATEVKVSNENCVGFVLFSCEVVCFGGFVLFGLFVGGGAN